MRETTKILDRLCIHFGTPEKPASDYQVAKLLGVTRASVSSWRVGRGTFSDEVAIRIADALNENPAYLLALAQSERTESEPARRVYKQIAQRYSRSAAAILAGLSVAAACSFLPSNQALASSPDYFLTDASMYYANWRRRLRHWIDRQLRRLFAPQQKFAFA